MSDFPNPSWPPLNVITPFHSDSMGLLIRQLAQGTGLTGCSSIAFTDELISYYPFRIFEPATAVKMGYMVGATAAGNVDLGIYNSQENLLVSTGLTAQGAINTLQEINITDTLLNPGTYYMAIKCTAATGTAFKAGLFADERIIPLFPIYEETGGAAAALPTAATFALTTATDIALCLMGVWFNTLV